MTAHLQQHRTGLDDPWSSFLPITLQPKFTEAQTQHKHEVIPKRTAGIVSSDHAKLTDKQMKGWPLQKGGEQNFGQQENSLTAGENLKSEV